MIFKTLYWNDLALQSKYSLRGVCKFPSSLTLAREKGSQNILERLIYEGKYKLLHYAVPDSVAHQGLLNCSFLLSDDLGATTSHYCS